MLCSCVSCKQVLRVRGLFKHAQAHLDSKILKGRCGYCEAPIYQTRKKYCNSSCAAKLNNKIRGESGWTPTAEHRAIMSQKLTGREYPNRRGLPSPCKGKRRVEYVVNACKGCATQFETSPSNLRVYCPDCPGRKLGGIRKNSGRSKSGYFKGIYCGSTYELAWVAYRLAHQLPVNRFKGYVIYDGSKKYYPDFVEGSVIYEIKGWTSQKTNIVLKAKETGAQAAGYTVVLLFKSDLAKEFAWCRANYNYRHLQEMYDDHKPAYSYLCAHCNTNFFREIKARTKITFCSQRCAGLGQMKERWELKAKSA